MTVEDLLARLDAEDDDSPDPFAEFHRHDEQRHFLIGDVAAIGAAALLAVVAFVSWSGTTVRADAAPTVTGTPTASPTGDSTEMPVPRFSPSPVATLNGK